MPAGSIFFTKVLNVTSIWNMFYLGISIYIVTEIYLIIKKGYDNLENINRWIRICWISEFTFAF